METVFENTYIDTYEGVAELNRIFWSKRMRFWGWVLFAGAIILLAIIVMHDAWRWLLFDLWTVAYSIYLLHAYKFWAKRAVRKIKKQNNGEIPPGIVTVTDKFNLQHKATSLSFPFEKLKEVYFLKHNIRIFSEDGAYMTFRRNGFQKGSAEELEVFIRQNCPQAAIIHKV